jgi:hypothetical protein
MLLNSAKLGKFKCEIGPQVAIKVGAELAYRERFVIPAMARLGALSLQ